MTLAYWCILIAALMPLMWAGIAKSGAEGYDNASPRAFMAQLKGRALRADWAQQNALESFAPFAAAVIIAHLTGTSQDLINLLAVLFVLFRILHGVFYIRDQHQLRSLVWLGGFLSMIGLFVASALNT